VSRKKAEFGRASCHQLKKPKMAGNPSSEAHLSDPRTHHVTALLIDWRGGDAGAVDKLIPLVHGELRRIAKQYMAGERPGHLLQATALVNEVYLRLVDINRVQWQDRAHFFAIAARLMRRVLVDAARAQKNQKRGGALNRVTFDQNLAVASETPVDLIAIDDALHALSEAYERKAQVVELRFFGGLSVEETAEVLKISEETVMRDWKFAKNWLMRELTRRVKPGSDGGQTGVRRGSNKGQTP
jgi:RNA polymerase sigma factor (TIGR02999 family)